MSKETISMKEAVARAIAGWTPNIRGWEDLCGHASEAPVIQAHYQKMATAAIKTVREPVDAITQSAQFLIDRLSELEWHDDGYRDVQRDYFGHVEPAIYRLRQAMIDAALSQE